MNFQIPIQVTLLLVAFVATLLLGLVAIPMLKKLKVGQNVREDGPQAHLSKKGTPSMGGLIFLTIFALIILLLSYKYPGAGRTMIPLLVVTLGFGAIGFTDDYIKVVKKRSTGLYAWQKMLLLLLVAGTFVYYITEVLKVGTTIYVPIIDTYFDLGKLYIPFAILVLLSTTNVVNITDGLDGLATGIVIIIMVFFTVLGIMEQNTTLVMFSSTLTGACLGFLVFNINPARVFMGDTGSLALGGVIGAISLIIQNPLILIIIAGVCVLEALSDIIQVVYFKLTNGKRIFKMAPLHHHFELCGMSETKVVWMFWGATIIFCVIGILII